MYKRLLEMPVRQSCFLFGPRGTGKTTFLKEKYSEAVIFNLLLEKRYQQLSANPEIFFEEVQALRKPQTIIIDEIQRLPELLNYVHLLIEEKKHRFILTGSSARQLKRAGVNLLAGRAVTRAMFPFLPEELASDFQLPRALRYGTLPVVWESEAPADTLEAYIETYLKEEIKAEALVKNLGSFSRFLQIAAIFHGQTLNVSNVARDAGVSRTTVNGYFEVLEDTLLSARLPAYVPQLKVREAKHDKFYLVDPGLVRSLKRNTSTVDSDEIGPLFEGFVFQILRGYQQYQKMFDELFYWQPLDAKAGEVDFLLRRGKSFVAVEVKGTDRLRPEHFKGMDAIQALSGLKRKILVYLGKETRRTAEGVEILSFKQFNELMVDKTLFD
jgi:predicted AAA+ superfamily ATPase